MYHIHKNVQYPQNYEPCLVQLPKIGGHNGEFWQNVVHWKREWQTTSVFLPWEPHEQCEKGKKIEHWNMNSRGTLVTNMLLEKSIEITPERMKRWSQSESNAQLWMWLVIEVKHDAIKNNVA